MQGEEKRDPDAASLYHVWGWDRPWSPLHRDPEEDGDDYGCYDDETNGRVAALVDELIGAIEAGHLLDGSDLIDAMRAGLTEIGEEATDAIVKENVRNALLDAVESAGLEVDWKGIYGW